MDSTLLEGLKWLEERQRARAGASPPLPLICIDAVWGRAFVNSKPVSLAEAYRVAGRITAKQWERAIRAWVPMVIVLSPAQGPQQPSSNETGVGGLREIRVSVSPLMFIEI